MLKRVFTVLVLGVPRRGPRITNELTLFILAHPPNSPRISGQLP